MQVNTKATQPKHSQQSLPPYQVRESQRAKNVSLKLSPRQGLEVVVPPGFDREQIPEILQKKQKWIDKVTQRFAAYHEHLEPDPDPLPEQIMLRAIAETWTVQYQPTSASNVTVTEKRNRQLLVKGAVKQADLCHAQLRRWLVYKAQLHLGSWLRSLSQEVQLPFGKTSVRGQKTRWASCSDHKDVSLNYKLLFLPPDVVRYVFIHELCHTIHLNHSKAFWALVSEKDPGYEALDTELQDAWRYLPEWIDPS